MSLGGPKTTTQYNQQQNQQQQQQQQGLTAGQSTITPNLPSWLQNYYQGFPGQQQNLIAQAQSMAGRPLYGPQQQANYQQQLNQQFGQAGQNLASSLARRGALNSTPGAVAQSGLDIAKANQMGNYLAQTPLLNAQFGQQALGQLGNIITNAMNWRPPVIGQTSDTTQLINQLMSGTSQSDTSGQQTQQQSGGLLQSLLGGLLNAGMGIATGGLSNLAQGLSWTGQGGGGVSDLPQSSGPGYTNPAGGLAWQPMAAPPAFTGGYGGTGMLIPPPPSIGAGVY